MLYSKRRKNLGRKKRSNRKSNISRMRGGTGSTIRSTRPVGLTLTFNCSYSYSTRGGLGWIPDEIKRLRDDVRVNANNMRVHMNYIFGYLPTHSGYPNNNELYTNIDYNSMGFGFADHGALTNMEGVRKQNQDIAIRNLQKSIAIYKIPSFKLYYGWGYKIGPMYLTEPENYPPEVYEQLEGTLETYIAE